jgi:hypothetical protein
MTSETNVKSSEKKVGDAQVQRQAKVKMIATAGHPSIKAGTKFEVHPVHEDDLKDKGWAVNDGQDHKKVKNFVKPLKPGQEAVEIPAAEEAGAGKEAGKDGGKQ